MSTAGSAPPPTAWVQRGFADFSRGQCEAGGGNLYVNARGIIEMIHRTDVNNDGFVDIILPNSHGYIERGPTWIYTQAGRDAKNWPRQELPNDSSWMSRVVDVDSDGYDDLIIANGENGVTSELASYIYWGGPAGLTGERAEFPTAGAYDVAVCDLTGKGLRDIIFPSAWVDHHNLGRPRLIQVFEQVAPRKFVVEGTIEQSGVPPDFEMLVPVTATYAKDRKVPLGRVVVTANGGRFRFTTSRKPVRVGIDGDAILAVVR